MGCTNTCGLPTPISCAPPSCIAFTVASRSSTARATVWIPSLMQKLTGGAEQVVGTGTTVRQIIDELDASHPGIRVRLVNEEADRVRPDIAVVIDGDISNEGMRKTVGEASEVHFLPAMSGG